MTQEEAQEIVNDIMAPTPECEQLRLLRFFHSPKLELLEPAKVRHKMLSGLQGPPEERAMTAAIGKR